jgi:hypothetical protein
MSAAGKLSGCREEDDMRTVKLDRERGQVLIMVAVMVVALFGFLALALDVGNIYGGRRRMQNAADAGALAGARDLCFGSGDPVQAKLVAEDYAINRNGAQSADVVVQDGITVSVVARQTLDTFVAGVIGIWTADTAAEAAAICGKAVSLSNVWPMAFDSSSWDENYACGQHLILWEDGKADCNTYSCTCSPGLGAAVPATDGRTWIDFSAVMADGQDDPCDQTGCGNAELGDRIEGETKLGPITTTCRSFIDIPSCTAGDSGVKAASWADAGDEAGKIKFIPLYDPDKSPCVMEKDPGDSCGTERWWIEDVGCIRVEGSCNLCEKTKIPPCPSGPKVIAVTISCDPECASAAGTTIGEKPGPGDIKAVSLVK